MKVANLAVQFSWSICVGYRTGMGISMDWNSIWESTISRIFVVIFGGVSAWIAYTFGLKGKEKSQIASQRKQEKGSFHSQLIL